MSGVDDLAEQHQVYVLGVVGRHFGVAFREQQQLLDGKAVQAGDDRQKIKLYALRFLSSGVTIAPGTNYTTATYPNNYKGLADVSLAFFSGILPRLDLREKNMLDLVLTANAAIYANGIAGLLNVDSGLAEAKMLRQFSAEELDRMIAFLRLKTGI